jgi:hypothetical protein
MHIVNVRRADGRLAETMSQMRNWLDHREIRPSLFDLQRACYRLEFVMASDAVAFAGAFGGSVVEDRTEARVNMPVPAARGRAIRRRVA